MSDNQNPAPNPRQQEERRGEQRRSRDDHEELINKFEQECIRGSAIARNVDAWNAWQEVKPQLVRRLSRA